MAKFLDQRKTDCRKNHRSNNFEKNASVQIIKTYILSLDEKLSSAAFLAVEKINIILTKKILNP